MKRVTLPLTYYDLLKEQRPPLLFDLVKQELASTDREDPAGSCADLSLAETYVDHVYGAILEQMRQTLPDLGDTEILEVIRERPEFERLGYQAEIDYLTAFNFELFGRKTFFIAPNLAEHLAHTSLNVRSDLIRAPFQTCLFVFTDPLTIEAFYRIDGEEHRMTQDPLSVFLFERPTTEGLRTLIMLCVHAGTRKTHMLVKRQLLIREDWDIEKMLATDWADLYTIPEDEAENEQRFYEDGLLFFRIVLNALLYLGSNEADLIEHLSPRGTAEAEARISPKWKKLRRRAQELSDLPYTAVGSGIGTIHIAKPEEERQPPERPQSYRIGSRFMVRGHWRQQPFGPGGTQRKLIWIRPYFKGPEMADLVNRPYSIR